jgi:hypothetical protein
VRRVQKVPCSSWGLRAVFAYLADKSLADPGTRRALAASMPGASHFKELIVWQLGDELRRCMFRLTARPQFRRDLKLHSQTEDALDSVSEEELRAPRRLVHRLVKGLSRFIAYLDRTPDQRNRPRTERLDDRGIGGVRSDERSSAFSSGTFRTLRTPSHLPKQPPSKPLPRARRGRARRAVWG